MCLVVVVYLGARKEKKKKKHPKTKKNTTHTLLMPKANEYKMRRSGSVVLHVRVTLGAVLLTSTLTRYN